MLPEVVLRVEPPGWSTTSCCSRRSERLCMLWWSIRYEWRKNHHWRRFQARPNERLG